MCPEQSVWKAQTPKSDISSKWTDGTRRDGHPWTTAEDFKRNHSILVMKDG